MLRVNLKATNSLTKYPSILTYHALGDRGRVTDTVQVDFDAPVLVTEKVDGTNARIIVHRSDYLIGSREELLHARGDCIHNPSMGIVEAIRPVAEALASGSLATRDHVLVLYGEVYGGKVTGASKHYTSSGAVGFRAFDVQTFDDVDFGDMLSWPVEKIAAWRDGGGQRFWGWGDVHALAEALGERTVPLLTPGAGRLSASPADTLAWMRQAITNTRAGIDAHGRPEGLVLRTADRSRIAKLRFEDYERGSRK